MSRALDRLDRWPRPIRWPVKAVLNVGGVAAGSFVFVVALAGTLLALKIAGLSAAALWRWLTG